MSDNSKIMVQVTKKNNITDVFEGDYAFGYIGNNESPENSRMYLVGKGEEDELAWLLGAAIAKTFHNVCNSDDEVDLMFKKLIEGFAGASTILKNSNQRKETEI